MKLVWSRKRPAELETGYSLVLIVEKEEDVPAQWDDLNEDEVRELGGIALLILLQHGSEASRGRLVASNRGELRRNWVHVHLTFPHPGSPKMSDYVSIPQGDEPT